jgi:hypothetical protein
MMLRYPYNSKQTNKQTNLFGLPLAYVLGEWKCVSGGGVESQHYKVCTCTVYFAHGNSSRGANGARGRPAWHTGKLGLGSIPLAHQAGTSRRRTTNGWVIREVWSTYKLWTLQGCGFSAGVANCLELFEVGRGWPIGERWYIRMCGVVVCRGGKASQVRSNFQGSLLSSSRKDVLICPRSGVSLTLLFSSLSHLTTLYIHTYLSLSCPVTPNTSIYSHNRRNGFPH